jgi:DNA invertase Pin-like site-specific DNA recombinase
MRAIGYVRVSTTEQGESGAGLAAQRAAIQAEAARRGWAIEWIEDVASGRDLKRPGMQTALDAMANGEADVLAVAKLDRLSRSLLDFAGLIERATREGWSLVSLDPAVDLTTPSGRLLANVMMSFASFEREIIGQRTREGLAAKRAAGVRLGRPLSLDPAVRERIRTLRVANVSNAEIARRFNHEGVPTAQGAPTWTRASVRAAALAR